ncbi:pseudouridine synthase [Lactifluus volemus]|nr:pseudouridine synthase [Lactifluus volemus]
MFLWKVSGSMESFGRAAAGSAATTKRKLQTCTSTTPPHYCHVLYVDRGVIVLNKPPGLVSQATAPSHDHDALSTTRTQARAAAPIVVDAAISKKNVNRRQVAAPPQSAVFDDVLYELRRRYELSTNPYPVHRLDKGTTGALILARSKVLARELSRQFRTRAIEKTYLALVRGGSKTFPVKEGSIIRSLCFQDGRVRIAGGTGTQAAAEPEPAGSKFAKTEWEVLASSDVAPVSLVRLYPHTGLKHQLRVHMAYVLKVPILGDTLYDHHSVMPTQQQVLASTVLPKNRLFLHSSSISFWRYRREGLHKRFRLTIVAPLPADFVKLCRDLNLRVPEDVVQGGALVDGERLREEEGGPSEHCDLA